MIARDRTAPTAEGPRPALQARSRRTLARILEATEKLLEEKLFEDVTIAEVVRKAGTSVGAFYTRFPGKDSLLPALYERYDRVLTEEVGESLDPRHWNELDLRQRTEKLVRGTVTSYRRRRGLMRAVAVFARSRPREISPSIREARTRLHRRIAEVLLERRNEIGHPHPELAVEMGVFFVFAACRDKILFGNAPHAESLDVDDESLVEEMTRALGAYLGLAPEPPRRRNEG